MNLYRDPWIAVQGPNGVRLIGLERLLCSEEAFTLCLPRDDMEMSTLQLAICLAQVAVMPENLKELKDCIRQPMDETEYRQRTERLVPWFQLDHPEWPFMQTVGVKAKEVTPIQKLLPGLPEGNNHCFFNNPGEVRVLGAPMAAVALFQQGSVSPSFGGGFKYPLRARGAAVPLSTLIWHEDLRRMVWQNVLSLKEVLKLVPHYLSGTDTDMPTWVRPIENEESADQIGLLRGLFWQPAHLKLLWEDVQSNCDLIGIVCKKNCKGFFKEKFNYSIRGLWPHPHSPRDLEDGFLSLKTQVPAWTNCYAYVYKESNIGNAGHIPAPVISQAQQLRVGQELDFVIGGYCNNQANVIERHHELISLGVGWEEQDFERLKSLLEPLLDMKKILRKKLFWLKNAQPTKKLRGIGILFTDEAERMFYQETEPLARQCLQTFTFKEAKAYKEEVLELGKDICIKIYDDLVTPFNHDPGMVASIAIGRRSLISSLRDLIRPDERKQTTKRR